MTVETHDPTLDAGALVPSVNIGHLLAQRDAIIERFHHAVQLLHEAAQMAHAVHMRVPRVIIAKDRLEDVAVDNIAQYQKRLDASAWDYLMKESGNLTFMDANKREEWQTQVRDLNVPEFTFESVLATFKHLYHDRQNMFERGVIRCFNQLSWDYKTNLPTRFGKRIIVTKVLSTWSKQITNYETCNSLDDLIRVLSILDGKSEPDHRQGTNAKLSEPFSKGVWHWPYRYETEYFSMKIYQNGNGHLTFTRPDLVAEMNKIIAKHYPGALPAPRD